MVREKIQADMESMGDDNRSSDTMHKITSPSTAIRSQDSDSSGRGAADPGSHNVMRNATRQ